MSDVSMAGGSSDWCGALCVDLFRLGYGWLEVLGYFSGEGKSGVEEWGCGWGTCTVLYCTVLWDGLRGLYVDGCLVDLMSGCECEA